MSDGQILEFDSQWFGIRVGRMDGDPIQADKWAQENHVELLYTLLPIEDVGSYDHALGFRVVDVRVEFERKTGYMRYDPQVIQTQVTEDDIDHTCEIARTSFGGTRFYNDRKLPKKLIDDLYENWLIKAYVDGFVALAKTSEIVGFVTVKDDALDLIAVSREFRGNGIGTELVNVAINKVFSNGYSLIKVVTQGGNISAQRLFQKCGFISSRTSIWLHKHYI